ncbi:membrane-spanning protein [Cutibacterium acnes JCM 18916]|nr:membrane-spanning protein [Cutibacterium acnes JCM 18916]
MALLGDAMWVGLLTLAGWGLFSGATLGYEFNHVDQKSAIEQAIHPAGSALLLGINVGYVLISLVGRLASPLERTPDSLLVDSTGRPAGRGHTFVIGLAFILSILGKTSVGVFASIGGTILFIEAVSVLTTKRGIIGKLMHVNLVDARCITPQPC